MDHVLTGSRFKSCSNNVLSLLRHLAYVKSAQTIFHSYLLCGNHTPVSGAGGGGKSEERRGFDSHVTFGLFSFISVCVKVAFHIRVA